MKLSFDRSRDGACAKYTVYVCNWPPREIDADLRWGYLRGLWTVRIVAWWELCSSLARAFCGVVLRSCLVLLASCYKWLVRSSIGASRAQTPLRVVVVVASSEPFCWCGHFKRRGWTPGRLVELLSVRSCARSCITAAAVGLSHSNCSGGTSSFRCDECVDRDTDWMS